MDQKLDLNSRGTPINRDDLFLLLKSYENQAQQSAILIEQIRQLMVKEEEIAKQMNESCSNLNSILTLIKDLKTSIEGGKTSFNTSVVDNVKSFSSIKNRLWIAFFGMVGIIITLISILVEQHHKFELLEKIATFLGVK